MVTRIRDAEGNMNSHDYLREERRRKIAANDLMSAGQIAMSRMQNGVMEDTTAEAINANKEHIAEIEKNLTAANVSFEN